RGGDASAVLDQGQGAALRRQVVRTGSSSSSSSSTPEQSLTHVETTVPDGGRDAAVEGIELFGGELVRADLQVFGRKGRDQELHGVRPALRQGDRPDDVELDGGEGLVQLVQGPGGAVTLPQHAETVRRGGDALADSGRKVDPELGRP